MISLMDLNSSKTIKSKRISNDLTMIIFLLLLLLFGSNIHAQQPEIESEIERNTFQMGEPVDFTIRVPLIDGQKIQMPEFDEKLSFHLEILSQSRDTVLEDNRKTLVQRYQITSFEAGEFLIKPIPVLINGDTFRTQSYQILVQEIEIDSAAVHFPNKPNMGEQYSYQDYFQRYWVYLVVVLVLILIFALIIYFFLREKKDKTQAVEIKTPFEEAKSGLLALDRKKYIQNGKTKSFYSDLSWLTKRYFGRIYDFPATELLSQEFVDQLSGKEVLSYDELDILRKFLRDADMVKFAKAELDQSKHTFYRSKIESLIDKAKPIDIPHDDIVEVREGEKLRKFRK